MPALGTFQVDIGLGVDQSLGLGTLDGQQWTRLTPRLGVTDSYVMSVSYQWGRDRFIHGDFETGLATVVLNNDTGEWSPNSGVNNLGGDKLRPGMLVRFSHQLDTTQLIAWLNANSTPTGWGGGGSTVTRDIANAETWIGTVDGAAWTNHGTANDLSITIPSAEPPLDGSGGHIRFLGRIYSIDDRYDEGGRGAVTVVTVADLMADLAQYNPGALGSPRAAETTGATGRFQFIITAALNSSGMYGTMQIGIYDVESSALPNNYMEEARVAARAEGGATFADHGRETGRLVFKAANWLITDPRSATIQAHLGGSTIGIVTASTDYSLARVFNTLVYNNTATTVTVTNATSVGDYSARTLTRTILNNSNTDLDSIADRDLALLKDAKLVIKDVTVKPRNVFETVWARQVTVGDLLQVTVQNNGWEYTQLLHVAGVGEQWTAASDDWTLTLRLDSREGDTVLT